MAENSSTSFTKHLQAPKLKDNGSNWVLYKSAMERYIIGYDISYWRHLTGGEKEPVVPSPKGQYKNY